MTAAGWPRTTTKPATAWWSGRPVWPRAGVDIIQVREQGLTDRALADMVRGVVGATAGTAAMVLMNDRADVAIVTECTGVHLPSAAPPGRRCAARHAGRFLDRALGSRGRRSAGLRRLAAITSRSAPCSRPPARHPGIEHPAWTLYGAPATHGPVPVQAIGGITLANVGAVAGAGAAGIAAIGLFSDECWSRGGADRVSAIVAAVRAAFAGAGATKLS